MPFAKINDIEMYYETSGIEGFPVILIHGVTISHILWKFQVPFLQPYFKVINLDLRNHGKSSKVETEITMELLADDVKLLLDELGIDEAIIIGESMGCFVSMEFALKYPEITKALVLTCGANADNTHFAAKAVLNGWISDFQEDPEIFIKRDVPHIACRKCRNLESAKDLFDEYYKLLRSYPKNPMINVFEGIKKFNVKDRLKEINCPTLIIHGKRDSLIGLPFANEVHQLIKNSLLEVINACHFALVHDPERFNEILLEFLKKNSK
ncbi:MAG: alpha/beta fold hydrolase [Candidatus Hodarchaeota archaeon]